MNKENKIKVYRILNNKGSALMTAYYFSIVLLGLSMAFLIYSINEGKSAERQRRTQVALGIAEAGIERAVYDLRQDCVDTPTDPDWDDGNINGIAIGPDTENFYEISAYAGNSLNKGSYNVKLKNVVGDDRAIWIKSQGSVSDAKQTILAYVKIYNISPLNTAVFAGAGENNVVIDSNANIFGSVHLIGSSLDPTDFAIDLGGDAYFIGNNYKDMPAGLKAMVPALATITYNGETVETLNSTLWVKSGLVGLSGSGTVGKADQTGNSYKERVDGVYVNDGFGGSQGASNVYSDNGTAAAYLLGDSITFPSLTDSYPAHDNYQDYLYDTSLVINDPADLAEFANLSSESNFTFTDSVNGYGSISMDGAGNLAISGKVYLDGGGITIIDGATPDGIKYTGEGIILSEGNVEIGDTLTTNGNNSFPANILGIMTPGTITFNRAGSSVMGLFYAEDTISITQDLTIVGSLISNYINMGENGPDIFQVPNVSSNIPAGMIGNNNTCYVKVLSWQKQQNE